MKFHVSKKKDLEVRHICVSKIEKYFSQSVQRVQRLKVGFVKDVYVVCEKKTRNDHKTVICHWQILNTNTF